MVSGLETRARSGADARWDGGTREKKERKKTWVWGDVGDLGALLGSVDMSGWRAAREGARCLRV